MKNDNSISLKNDQRHYQQVHHHHHRHHHHHYHHHHHHHHHHPHHHANHHDHAGLRVVIGTRTVGSGCSTTSKRRPASTSTCPVSQWLRVTIHLVTLHHHLFLIIIYTSTSDEEYLKSLGGESASTGDSYPHCYHHPLPPLSYIYLSIISIYLPL